jgi:hypothetical protein
MQNDKEKMTIGSYFAIDSWATLPQELATTQFMNKFLRVIGKM